MGKLQHRLSFSRAEIVLINSWMPVQQIVYHMLRYFIKSKRLTESVDNSEAGTLSNYHIKTLLLWACELKPKSWWTDDVNIVRICVELLHTLAQWLTYTNVPQYFVNACNLIGNSFYVTNIGDHLMSVGEVWLSKWFMDNYIQKCLQFDDHPRNISLLFDYANTSTKLHNAVSALVAWKQNRSRLQLLRKLSFAELQMSQSVLHHPLTSRSCGCWMTHWTDIDSCLYFFSKAVALLHVASRYLRYGLNDELIDILATVCGLQFADIRRNFYHSSSVSALNIAAKLMKVVANSSFSTMSSIEIELSKAYLYRALRCKDSDSNSIYCLINVYLAVLYYNTGQYQTTTGHCSLVTRSRDHSRCSSHVVQGKFYPRSTMTLTVC